MKHLLPLPIILLFLLAGPASCKVIRVKPGGVDLSDGSTWGLAKKTITAALSAAASGDEIWVAAGTYSENITLKDGVAVYGGFAVGDAYRDARRISRNVTTIDGRFLDNAVKAPAGTGDETRLDGFVVRNGAGGPSGGVHCYNSYATIANNVITNCSTANGNGGGIFVSGGAVTIANNLIYKNSAPTGLGGGIHCHVAGGDTTIVNNTIADNSASEAGGIYLNNLADRLRIVNNIVSFNSSGIRASTVAPDLAYNCVHGNTAYDYSGVIGPGTGDMSRDPLFIDRVTSNYHLRTASPASPCINAGSNSARRLPVFDIDGQGRVNAAVDMGADETWPDAQVAITSPTSDPAYVTSDPTLAIGGAASEGTLRVTWANDRGGSGTCSGTTVWSASGIGLSVGSNVIMVTADAAVTTATATLTVFFDSALPNVAITSPTTDPAYATSDAVLAIAGTASDDTGVINVSWSNNSGGSGVCIGTTSWSASVGLLPGENVITVTASDASGNAATDAITVSYDNVAPTVSITAPTDQPTYVTTAPRVDPAGTASDDVGVTRVDWSNDRGGSGTCTGAASWSASGIVLQPGANEITVTARDAAGNTVTDVLTVTFTDVTPPVCTITSPTANASYATRAKLSIGGSASDDAGVASAAWANDRGASGTCTGKTSWSASNIQLQPGVNLITVTAIDTSGNAGSDVLSVTFTDATPPVVTITSPLDASVTRTCATVDLAGTASDDVAVTGVYWWNDRGGSEACTGTTTWSAADIALQAGANVITIVATDSSGNTGTASVTVTYASVSPGDAWKGLSMVSMPVIPDEIDPLKAVGFKSLWVAYRPELGDYALYPDRLTWLDPPAMTPGRGFWGYFDGTGSAPCGTVGAQDQPVAIHLFAGWNLIGQPFLAAVKWDLDDIQVQAIGGAALPLRHASALVGTYAWGWDNVAGRYYLVYDSSVAPGIVDRLEPWRGYWIKAAQECDLILPAPPSYTDARGSAGGSVSGTIGSFTPSTTKRASSQSTASGRAAAPTARCGEAADLYPPIATFTRAGLSTLPLSV